MIGQSAKPKRSARSAAGFTLIELLVVVMVIIVLASIVFGALSMAQNSARQRKTQALIAKLHQPIMERYESYATRRMPINTNGMNPADAAALRLNALRDTMRMEMPDRFTDISSGPHPNSGLGGRPAVAQLYYDRFQAKEPSPENNHAECLYLVVSVSCPEAMENFKQTDIGDTDGDGWLEFLDGWGQPIYFLRRAPGFSDISEIQIPDADAHHDAFDTQRVRLGDWHLIPLIYSSGPDKELGINVGDGTEWSLPEGPFSDPSVGMPDGTDTHDDNVHNHLIDAK